MRINGSIFDPLRPDRATPLSNPAVQRPGDPSGQGTPNSSPKSDSVSFSDAGRSMAARLEQQNQAAFDPERVAELRTKVLNGAYNTLDVVDQVARRILSRGDI
jgi:anti-sigma28 factor (negative regulator of flagellin synthesis)